jgi:microcystin-dependent protein
MSVNDLKCNGQFVNKFKYAALFEEIGNTYGESGDDFAVPTIVPLAAGSPETLIYIIRT